MLPRAVAAPALFLLAVFFGSASRGFFAPLTAVSAPLNAARYSPGTSSLAPQAYHPFQAREPVALPPQGRFSWALALAGASLSAAGLASTGLRAAAVAAPQAGTAEAARMAARVAPGRRRAPPPFASSLSSEEDKAFHAVGYNIGKQLQQQLRNIEKGDVDALLTGIKAALLDEPPEVDLPEYIEKVSRIIETREAERAKKAKDAAGEFLKAAAAEDGAKQTDSGLVIKILEDGSGDSPTAADTVEVNYEGTLIDGTVFDSSYQRGESISFPLSGVIKGWTEGLQLMKPGGKAVLTIPPDIAYGERGSPPVIPPQATLVFTIELIAVK